MSKLLDQPARKMFVRDLMKCRPFGQVPGEPVPKVAKDWLLTLDGRRLEVSTVWIQGVVVKALEGSDTLYLDDGTAVAMVIGCSKVPFVSQIPGKGNYAMFIGQLASVGSCPIVKAVKIQNLNKDVTLETMWPLEVIDQTFQSR